MWIIGAQYAAGRIARVINPEEVPADAKIRHLDRRYCGWLGQGFRACEGFAGKRNPAWMEELPARFSW